MYLHVCIFIYIESTSSRSVLPLLTLLSFGWGGVSNPSAETQKSKKCILWGSEVCGTSKFLFAGRSPSYIRISKILVWNSPTVLHPKSPPRWFFLRI